MNAILKSFFVCSLKIIAFVCWKVLGMIKKDFGSIALHAVVIVIAPKMDCIASKTGSKGDIHFSNGLTFVRFKNNFID